MQATDCLRGTHAPPQRTWPRSGAPSTARCAVGRAAPSYASSSSIRKNSGTGASSRLITLEEVQQAARNRGLSIYVRELGPFYRIVCREGTDAVGGAGGRPIGWGLGEDELEEAAAGRAAPGQGRVLGLTTGFVVPALGLMHCDTLQVFTRGLRGDAGERVRGGALGLGLLLGGATFAYGASRGVRTAEILAINDEDAMHERLVRYYAYFGFKRVVEVTGKMSDLGHMLVWGGAGTRMDADVQAILSRWTPRLRAEALGQGSSMRSSSSGVKAERQQVSG